jgi:hypothetical protein
MLTFGATVSLDSVPSVSDPESPPDGAVGSEGALGSEGAVGTDGVVPPPDSDVEPPLPDDPDVVPSLVGGGVVDVCWVTVQLKVLASARTPSLTVAVTA